MKLLWRKFQCWRKGHDFYPLNAIEGENHLLRAREFVRQVLTQPKKCLRCGLIVIPERNMWP